MMLTRRTTLLLASASAAVLALRLPMPAAFAQSPASAVAFVRQTGDALTTIANGPGDEAQRKARLAEVVDQNVDIDGVARFCLGRFWRVATPAQQSVYLRLFHRVLDISITSHIGEYRGVRFTVGAATPGQGGMSVATVIDRPNSAPANVGWIVDEVGGQLKIIDVVAEGTSLRVTQRADYLSFLARNGNSVQALIDALQRQVSLQG